MIFLCNWFPTSFVTEQITQPWGAHKDLHPMVCKETFLCDDYATISLESPKSPGCRWGHALQVLKSFYNQTYFERYGVPLDGNTLLLLWSCTVSMFPLGGLLGSLGVGLLVDRCGR